MVSVRSRYALLGAATFLLLHASTATAAALISSAEVFFSDESETELSIACSSANLPISNQSSCTGAATVPGTSANLIYSTKAISDYGVLKASGSSSISNPLPSGVTEYSRSTASALAAFRDQWIITGAQDGTIGTLTLEFALTGSYDFSQPGVGITTSFGLINYTAQDGSSDFLEIENGAGVIDDTLTLTTSFTFGSEFDFLVLLSAASNIFDLTDGGVDGSSSFINLDNTATLNLIFVTDVQGNVVPFELSTSSNARLFNDLTAGPLSVPEPPVLALAMVALVIAAGCRRRRGESISRI